MVFSIDIDNWYIASIFKIPKDEVYVICETSDELDGMLGYKHLQKISIPKDIFHNFLLKLIQRDKTLMAQLLETSADELRNPTKICQRCNQIIAVNETTCKTCVSKGYI